MRAYEFASCCHDKKPWLCENKKYVTPRQVGAQKRNAKCHLNTAIKEFWIPAYAGKANVFLMIKK
jgi:hypothetical protein